MIPSAIQAAMFSPDTTEDVIAIFVIDREAWDAPLRFTSYEGEILSYDPLRSGVVHDGEEYTYAVVAHARPSDVPGTAATIPLVLENVVQDLGEIAETSVNDLTVTLTHVAKSDPDSIVEEFPTFLVLSATANEEQGTLALELTLDPIENEPLNMVHFTPDQFGALFP